MNTPNVNQQVSSNIQIGNEANKFEKYSDETIDSLSNGVVNILKPSLCKVREQLHELTTKQHILMEQIHNENLKLAAAQNSPEFQETFNNIKIYHDKLLNIKKSMKLLLERTAKLKKRTLRLQQHKDKMLLLKTQQVKQEQDLVGKSEVQSVS